MPFSLIEASEQESVIVEYGDDSEDENQDDSEANTPPEAEVENNNHSDDEEEVVSESDDIIAKEIIDFLNSPTAEDDEEHQGELDNSFDNTKIQEDHDSGTGEDKEPSIDENQTEVDAEADTDGDKDSANGPSEDPDNQTEEEIETKSEVDEEETIEERNESEEAEIETTNIDELFGMYKKKFKDISTNPVSSTSQKLKIYHFDVASQFKNLVGGLEDVRGELTIEELFVMYKKKFKVIFTNLLVRFRSGL